MQSVCAYTILWNTGFTKLYTNVNDVMHTYTVVVIYIQLLVISRVKKCTHAHRNTGDRLKLIKSTTLMWTHFDQCTPCAGPLLQATNYMYVTPGISSLSALSSFVPPEPLHLLLLYSKHSYILATDPPLRARGSARHGSSYLDFSASQMDWRNYVRSGIGNTEYRSGMALRNMRICMERTRHWRGANCRGIIIPHSPP